MQTRDTHNMNSIYAWLVDPPVSDSGTLRHGSTISRISAVSALESYLHLIFISLTSVHVLALHMFCIER